MADSVSLVAPYASYIFLVHTSQYAGNFEREMVAFMTGKYGDDGVGERIADETADAFPDMHALFDDCVAQVPDDEDGCLRPAAIWPSKPGTYNTVATFFYKKPTQKMIDFMKKRAEEFAEKPQGLAKTLLKSEPRLIIKSFELLKLKQTVSVEKLPV